MHTYEKLGAFYLGRTYDPDKGKPTDELLLYDAKDLTTHAVCVGMTGSGKTGLCITLLEEAAIDGIPAIVIDPKGDMGNLMLTFPDLSPDDFQPWVDEAEAQRNGMTIEEFARDRAALWRKGLGKWDQDGDRIRRFRESVDLAMYTPGSQSGVPLCVLRSLSAPAAALQDDDDALRERVSSAVSGLLALLGINADPIRSREHILLSSIIDRAWRTGRDLELATLIALIQSPPFDRVGVMDIESFYPSKDRASLAMSLNSLLASPGFAAWMEGEPLEIERLLYTKEGKPRIAILSIAHLSDSERMFFVTLLLNEVISWMRAQSGTSSLRALLYMDEIFGFFPPTANPPSKTPMLTLLKQARAYGLGVVLATQNPVDLDYKGLSNTGTWFLGRLQTERDKMRVLDGLEGASTSSGARFDRAAMEATLSGLDSRVFLMNNVHEDEPVLFHTRWALSYLRGPLTRNQIRDLTTDHREAAMSQPAPTTRMAAPVAAEAAPMMPEDAADDHEGPVAETVPPSLPSGVLQRFVALNGVASQGETVMYRPALFGTVRQHFVRVSAKIDDWTELSIMGDIEGETADDVWAGGDVIKNPPDLERRPEERGSFAPLPDRARKEAQYKTWTTALQNYVYREHAAVIWHCKSLKTYSELNEEEGAFRVRLREKLHEQRDLAVEKLRKKYAPKITTMQNRVRKAEQKVEVQKSQMKQHGLSTAISMGATVLGAMFGRKTKSVGTVSRAGTTVRSAGRMAREKGDISRAEEDVLALQQRLEELEAEFEEEVQETELSTDVDGLEVEEITLRPRKSDLNVKLFAVVWLPYIREEDGTLMPAFEVE